MEIGGRIYKIHGSNGNAYGLLILKWGMNWITVRSWLNPLCILWKLMGFEVAHFTIDFEKQWLLGILIQLFFLFYADFDLSITST